MLNRRQKQILLDLLDTVQISGNRDFVTKKVEELDAITQEVKALPVADPEEPAGEEKAADGDAAKVSNRKPRRRR